MEKLTNCDCIDCGGDGPSHSENCEEMSSMFGERNFDRNPYTPEEKRVADYIVSITNGQVGAGDDPIGFILASHNFVQLERRKLVAENAALKAVQEVFYYLAKWVERGLFDHHHTPKEALEVIAHHPGMPWKEGRWDVDHKPYASSFYKKFPKAKGDATQKG